MMTIRRWHAYIGAFTAPTVLFFALTGAAQLYSLHESHGDYEPPAILEKLSSVHKDQVYAFGHHHKPPAQEGAPPKLASSPQQDAEEKTEPSTLALRAFFLVVALCLVTSTTLGLWMGFTQTRQKRSLWILFIAGVLIPAGLLLL
jgi:hypothetical protein